MHENYPDAIKIWFIWRKSFFIRLKNRIFFNYKKWATREHKMVHKFDYVIAVVEEMKIRLIQENGLKEMKIRVVSNTEPRDIFISNPNIQKAFESRNLIYVGGIGPHRGLDTAIRGMAYLKTRKSDFKLIIVGSGNSDTINYLQELARNEDVSDTVKFTGPVPFDEALRYMQTAFLNIIPHNSNGHTDHTIPHKIFQIMNSGFPLLVSSSPPLKRIVESYNAGVVFDADNPEDFAKRVVWSDEHHDLLLKFSENAKDAVVNKGLNWETDAEQLIWLYDSL